MKASAEYVEIVSSDEPFAKLRASLEMDLDGLKSVATEIYRAETENTFFQVDTERAADYATQVLGPMAARFADYIAALRFLAIGQDILSGK